MTGDGVNDLLALKQADVGIAMGTGSGASRSAAQFVLLDGGFAALPVLVAEGRRVIANIERVAVLFLTKSVYAFALALALATGVARLPFPFLHASSALSGPSRSGSPRFSSRSNPTPPSPPEDSQAGSFDRPHPPASLRPSSRSPHTPTLAVTEPHYRKPEPPPQLHFSPSRSRP